MKFSNLIVASSMVVSATAFAPVMHQRRAFIPFPMTATEEASETGSDFGSAMPASETVYERLGVAEDKVAIGVDASEILQWLGSREDIVEKFLRDNKKFDRERAETEVDKFLLDAEMMMAYINFEKRKASAPQDLKQEAMDNITDPQTIATYAAWIIGGAGFSYVRKFVVEPKFASGEWEPIHINLGGMFGDKSADVVADTVDAATNSL